MTPTNDPARIEELFKKFFEDIFSHDHLKKGFLSLNKQIELSYRNPETNFLIECREDPPRFIPHVDGSLKPDITIMMDWETAHAFWMGNLDTISALFSQRIKVFGDAAALLDLKPLFKETSTIYKQTVSKCFGDKSSTN